MKIIFKIVVILLVAAVIAGCYTLIANQTSRVSGSDPDIGRPAALTRTDGTRTERHAGAGSVSLGMGLQQVLVTLAKLSGIAILVLLIEKVIGRIQQGKFQTGLPRQ